MFKRYLFFVVLFLTAYIIAQDKPVGIQNAGNTCFMNSALQCLYHSNTVNPLNSLTSYLISLPQDYYKPQSASAAYLNFLKIYQKNAQAGQVIQSDVAKINWCVNLTKLIPLTSEEKQEGHIEKPFGNTQDASELTIQLLSHLIINDVNPQYFNNLRKYPFPLYPLPKNQLTDLLVTIITGYKQSIDKVTKNPIEESRFTSEAQYVLPVNIVQDLPEDSLPLKDTVKIFKDLDSALRHTFNHKQFSPKEISNPFYELKKILKLPEILILALNRFTYLADSAQENNKIYNRITFPLNDLTLENFLVDPNSQEAKYDLYGIVMHHFEGAHYTAYVKVNDHWYECDDFDVQEVSENAIKKVAMTEAETENVEIRSDIDNITPRDSGRFVTPYMLFYRQKKGKRVALPEKKITDAENLKRILTSKIPKTYLPLPYIDMYLSVYKMDLNLVAQGINDGFLNLSYIQDVFLSWVEEKEKAERKKIEQNFINPLKNITQSLVSLRNRLIEIRRVNP